MFSRYRWAKKMRNPNDEYDRLHDHMTAIARERDWLQREVERLTDELYLAHEALRREMP
jgi:predicted  nucleic acid-binding Zn-ribbon protein